MNRVPVDFQIDGLNHRKTPKARQVENLSYLAKQTTFQEREMKLNDDIEKARQLLSNFENADWQNGSEEELFLAWEEFRDAFHLLANALTQNASKQELVINIRLSYGKKIFEIMGNLAPNYQAYCGLVFAAHLLSDDERSRIFENRPELFTGFEQFKELYGDQFKAEIERWKRRENSATISNQNLGEENEQ